MPLVSSTPTMKLIGNKLNESLSVIGGNAFQSDDTTDARSKCGDGVHERINNSVLVNKLFVLQITTEYGSEG